MSILSSPGGPVRSVRPAPGAAVVWDDTGGTSGDSLFYVGSWNGSKQVTNYITFDPAGTGGSFTVQNYALGQVGLIDTFWVDHVAFNGFHTSGITGLAGGQLSWTVYVSSDGVHSGSNITFNDWTVGPSANRNVGGLTTYHDPNAHGVTALRWKISGASSAIALWGPPAASTSKAGRSPVCNTRSRPTARRRRPSRTTPRPAARTGRLFDCPWSMVLGTHGTRSAAQSQGSA